MGDYPKSLEPHDASILRRELRLPPLLFDVSQSKDRPPKFEMIQIHPKFQIVVLGNDIFWKSLKRSFFSHPTRKSIFFLQLENISGTG